MDIPNTGNIVHKTQANTIHRTGDEPMYSRKVSGSCFLLDISCATHSQVW